jgi:putative membrane protein
MFDHGGGLFGFGFMWIFWILLIVVIVLVIKAITGAGGAGSSPGNETPLDILKKRYARGEIDEEEFERRRKELES